jgi:hypothetical protein
MLRYGPMYGPDVTFLGVDPCTLEEPGTYAGAGVVILGAPFDGGTSHRPGHRGVALCQRDGAVSAPPIPPNTPAQAAVVRLVRQTGRARSSLERTGSGVSGAARSTGSGSPTGRSPTGVAA